MQNVSPQNIMGQSLINSIHLYGVTNDHIGTIVKSLNTGPVGYDEMNASISKYFPCGTEPLVYVIDKSLEEGYSLQNWRPQLWYLYVKLMIYLHLTTINLYRCYV